ncbi:hypothetical protein NXY00_19810 [Bacteroides sp. BFG-551]|nr:hypothetical protein [Bacteroides sp. BFG-551]
MTNHTDLSLLIPSGTAIQNGRTSFLGDAFNRDGYHPGGYLRAIYCCLHLVRDDYGTKRCWQPVCSRND